MAKEQAAQFLEKMMKDPQLQAKIKEAYRKMICDIASQAGFTFTPQELQQAMLLREYCLADEMLEKVTGGMMNTSKPIEGRIAFPTNQ